MGIIGEMNTRRLILLFIFVIASFSVRSQPEGFTFHSDLAENWLEGGNYFEWTSTTKNNKIAIKILNKALPFSNKIEIKLSLDKNLNIRTKYPRIIMLQHLPFC